VEYGAEKLLRDAVVLPIYEGTSQIQALMAMKDNLMRIFKRPRAFVSETAAAMWRCRSSRSPIERRVARIRLRATRAIEHLTVRLAGQKIASLRRVEPSSWLDAIKQVDPKRDFAPAMLHAERLTRILADAAICEELHTQARQFPEREQLLERYLERAEPRTKFLLDEISSVGGGLLESLEGEDAPDASRVS
jgi:hypothetical protein